MNILRKNKPLYLDILKASMYVCSNAELYYKLKNDYYDVGGSCKTLVSSVKINYIRIFELTDRDFYDKVKIAHVLVMLEYLSVNEKDVFDKYNKAVGKLNTLVILESYEKTLLELKILFRYITKDYKTYQGLLQSATLFPHYKQFCADLYTIIRMLSGSLDLEDLKRGIRSEAFCQCIIHYLSSYTYDCSNCYPLLCICTSVDFDSIKEVIELTDKDLEEYNELDKQYRKDMKALRLSSKSSKSEEVTISSKKNLFTDRDDLLEDVEVIDSKNTIVDKISTSSMREYLKGCNILLLHSKNVNILKLDSCISVYDISSVSSEVLSKRYDAVVVLTKGVKHSDVFRVKSYINSKLIYCSNTNRQQIYRNIYLQL